MVDFEKNTPLVYYIYNTHYKKMPQFKEDLIQCGMLGLWKACQSFDENGKSRFSTFASICIRNEMRIFLRREMKFFNNIINVVDTVFEGKYGIEQDILSIIEDETSQQNIDMMLLLDKTDILKEYIKRKTLGEIAKEQGKTIQKVANELIREKKIVAEMIKE